MKKFLPGMLAMLLLLSAACAETVTIGEWKQGNENSDASLCVIIRQVFNPVFALVEDSSDCCGMFGLYAGEDQYLFGEGGFAEGDRLIVSGAVVNEFEGNVEMIDSQLCDLVTDESIGSRITLKEWLDADGMEGVLLVRVNEIINPVLAAVTDGTAEVSLFGLQVGGEFTDFITLDLHAGDLLLIKDPVCNQFEGNTEMADSVLLRRFAVITPEMSGEEGETVEEPAGN